MSLSHESCVPCRDGAAALNESEISALWQELPGWAVALHGGVRRLERRFNFPDFSSALSFAVKVGALADAQDHHPAVLVEWGGATVSWWTHKVKGLHRNDFICAAKTELLHAG